MGNNYSLMGKYIHINGSIEYKVIQIYAFRKILSINNTK